MLWIWARRFSTSSAASVVLAEDAPDKMYATRLREGPRVAFCACGLVSCGCR